MLLNVLRWTTLGVITLSAACVLGTPSSCVSDSSPKAAARGAFGDRDKALDDALEVVRFRAKKAPENVSDATMLDARTLVAVTDEGTELALVDVESGAAKAVDVPSLDAQLAAAIGSSGELDLEAVARHERTLFVSGSASLKRLKPKSGKDNAARLASVVDASGEGTTGGRYLIALDAKGSGVATELTLRRFIDLRAVLLTIPALAPFADIPSKDNGLDVEGLAADATSLYVGLRGPVLRGHAVVVRMTHAGENPELRFLSLRGLGIRGLSIRTGGGLWVLAGPTMELDAAYVLARWDGATSVFAEEPSAALIELAEVPHEDGKKPEGVFERGDALCAVFDGPRGGAPACTRLSQLAK